MTRTHSFITFDSNLSISFWSTTFRNSRINTTNSFTKTRIFNTHFVTNPSLIDTRLQVHRIPLSCFDPSDNMKSTFFLPLPYPIESSLTIPLSLLLRLFSLLRFPFHCLTNIFFSLSFINLRRGFQGLDLFIFSSLLPFIFTESNLVLIELPTVKFRRSSLKYWLWIILTINNWLWVPNKYICRFFRFSYLHMLCPLFTSLIKDAEFINWKSYSKLKTWSRRSKNSLPLFRSGQAETRRKTTCFLYYVHFRETSNMSWHVEVQQKSRFILYFKTSY